jgi:tRNA A-37 threonylcarbamoyl transferase component Bud32
MDAVSEPRVSVTEGRRRRPSGEPPPLPHELNPVAIGWLMAFVFWSSIWSWVFLSDAPARWITERDLELMAPIVEHRPDWLTPVMQRINEIGTSWLTPVVGWTTIVVGLAARRIRHVLLLITSLSIVAALQTVVSVQILRPRPLGVEQIGEWAGPPQPSRPIALATTVLVCAGLTLVPAGHWRRVWIGVTAVCVAVLASAQVYLGVEHPSDPLPAATLGVATTLVLYLLVAPEQAFPIVYGAGRAAHLDVAGSRGEVMRVALSRQLDIEATAIEPTGLAGSAGSTPLRIDRADGSPVFGKLYASTHLRSDRSYKLGRALLYGRLEDEQHFNSVRHLVQHEDYMLHVMQRVGIDSMRPLGIVELTPDREYLLVGEFLEGAVEIGSAEVTTEVIDSALAVVSQLWDAGLAHRDIKPANVMVRGDRVHLVDLSFAEVRPSPWRQAVDLANMMLVLALRSTPELVYERALLRFSEDDIAEAFAAVRSVALPSALRSAVDRDGRDLLGCFRRLAPDRRPVAVQRWSLRRVGLMLWVAAVTIILISVFVDHLTEIGLQ